MSFSRSITGLAVSLAVGLVVVASIAAGTAHAGERLPHGARHALDLADAAARAWATDASLVYVENDEDLGGDGRAGRWGYLYYSSSLDAARGYSVRDGEIVVAEDLALRFAAPPVSPGWIDSGAALAAADEKVGAELRKAGTGATPTTMLLIRGAFHTDRPDMTTWLVVYTTPGAPSTFVVVDAHTGDVRRTWRG